jgi:hypothetical protein
LLGGAFGTTDTTDLRRGRRLELNANDCRNEMKLGLVIASHGRPEILEKVLMDLLSQHRVPDEIVISAVDPTDIPKFDLPVDNLKEIFGSPGSSCQRNRGISYLIDKTDLILFLDDDFIVGDGYLASVEKTFQQDSTIIGLTGEVIADGANSVGFTFEDPGNLRVQHGVSNVQHRRCSLRRTITVIWLAGRFGFLRSAARQGPDY